MSIEFVMTLDSIHSFISEFLNELWNIRLGLGQIATIPGDTSSGGKRQTKFENVVFEIAKRRLPVNCAIEAEGYPVCGNQSGDWIIGLDPTDGTAGDARSSATLVSESLPVSTVITVRKRVYASTFASVVGAGILDLRRGCRFLVFEKRGVWKEGPNSINFPLPCLPQYNHHAPAVGVEITRRANSFLRFLIPYGLYPEMVADSHSSAMVMLWALQGYIDAYFNFNLPGMSGAGQRGHELGAIAVFARAMGACAVQTECRDGKVAIVGSLDDAPYIFDGQTSVIAAPDQTIVEYYLTLINRGLDKTITLNDGLSKICMRIGDILPELYLQYPNERWSLPLIKT